MDKPIVVSSFRGPTQGDAGSGNVGDVTLRLAGADATTDIVLPDGAGSEVFSAIRGAESALSTVLNAVAVASSTTQPAFTSVAPTHAAKLTATPIVITGTGFVSGAKVYVGGLLATAIVVNSATTIHCTTSAALDAGAFDIAVINPNAKVGFGVGAWTSDA